MLNLNRNHDIIPILKGTFDFNESLNFTLAKVVYDLWQILSWSIEIKSKGNHDRATHRNFIRSNVDRWFERSEHPNAPSHNTEVSSIKKLSD